MASKMRPQISNETAPSELTVSSDLNALEWTRSIDDKKFVVSTRRDKLDLEFINASFDTEAMPWAKSTTMEGIRKMVDNSVTFGLYMIDADSTSTQIGMARLITDHVTFAYLTDVLVIAEHRRYGHARWLLKCCRQVMESMPILRRGMLLTGLSYGEQFYKETLDFHNITSETGGIVCLTGKLEKQTS